MRVLAVSLGSVLLALALFEITMQPTANQRLELGLIFSLMALAMAVAAIWLPRMARRSPSLRITVAALSLTSFVIVLGGAVAIADRMFISDHDLTLLLVILAFGVISAIGFAVVVSRPMTSDLDRLASHAADVARGSLEARVALDRQDELGRLGSAVDQMMHRLDAMETERAANDEARKAFFAAVGHDLRTPLSSLRAAVEALQDGLAGDTDRFLASMDKDIAALSNLVDDVFLLASLDTGGLDLDLAPVDVTRVIAESVEVLRPVAARRDVGIVSSTERSAYASADVGALSRVMRNLLDNAIRHAPAGSDVVVTISQGSGTITVTVTDDGEGFAAEFVSSAFERFTREDPARGRATGGSGLGLAIASGFVSAMGGEIWAEPGPQGRVAFRLRGSRSPVTRPESSPRVPSDTALTAASSRRR